MTYDPFSMCAGKASYPSANAATRAMKGLAKRRCAKPHNGLDPYRCGVCSKWHLGRPPTTSKKMLRKMRDRAHRRLGAT